MKEQKHSYSQRIGKTTFIVNEKLMDIDAEQEQFVQTIANRIMVLEDGRIIERGDHNALMAQQGRYYQLCTGKAKLS